MGILQERKFVRDRVGELAQIKNQIIGNSTAKGNNNSMRKQSNNQINNNSSGMLMINL